jgi:hypothetical protein
MGTYEHSDGDTVFEGYLSIDKSTHTKRPYVMVSNVWESPNDHLNAGAEDLSKKRYVGFVIDVY